MNYGYYTQSAQAQASVARQVSVAVSFSRAVQQAWKLELKISEYVIVIPCPASAVLRSCAWSMDHVRC